MFQLLFNRKWKNRWKQKISSLNYFEVLVKTYNSLFDIENMSFVCKHTPIAFENYVETIRKQIREPNFIQLLKQFLHNFSSSEEKMVSSFTHSTVL